MSISLSDSTIRSLATIVPDHLKESTLMTPGPNNTRSDTELLARVLRSESADLNALAGIAQELLNRLRYRRVLKGADMNWHILGNYSVEYGSWREILYSESAYSGLKGGSHLTANPMEVASGATVESTAITPAWRKACNLAWELTHLDPMYDRRISENTPVDDQLFHRGISALELPNQEALRLLAGAPSGEKWWTNAQGEYIATGFLVKTRHSILIWGDTVFFNENDDTNGNNINNIYVPVTGDSPDNNTGIPTQTASDLIDFLKSRVGCGYVLGTYGQICTSQLLQNRAVADPENGTAYYLGDCARWLGKLVTDCSGLVEWFLLKRGVTNCDSYSGGMYKHWCSTRSTDINTMPRIPGVAVFKRNSGGIYHMGIYVGKDRVIEAKGAMYGIVVTQFSTGSWNAWGYLDWLDYDLIENNVSQLPLVADALTYGPLPGYPDIRTSSSEAVQHSGSYSSPVYQKGDSGPMVEMIRRRFWAENSAFVVNDFFDDTLENRVKAFQTAQSLTSDGKVGSGTWKILFPVLQKKSGSQNGAAAMQALLNYQNYPVGTPDGLFGTGTETVLKAYQKARTLDPDGVCGQKTWQSLTLDEPFADEVLVDQNGDSTALCVLGDNNSVVRQLQARLSVSYPTLSVTGLYNTATDACVTAFQNANGITANGVVGPITWGRLFPLLRLGRGTRDEVLAMQVLLYRQKHGVLIDGIFGSGTLAAVKAYQTLRGLTSDGIVGPTTWTSLCLATPPSGDALYFGTGGGDTGAGGSDSSSMIYREGNTGAVVHQLKRRMAVENLFTGTVNSTFDAALTYAVKQYQAAEGTRIDGLVGPATWSLLFPIVKKQSGQQSGAKAVQALLNLNGYSVGTPDGLFGTGSETKLIQFQTAKGLTADGLCGAQTWAKLCEI